MGHIPNKFIFFCQRPYQKTALDGNKYSVTATYIVEDKKGNKKQIENAGRWASEEIQRNGNRERIAGERIAGERIDFENKILDSVRIIGLDIRGNGGRAYKVLVNEKFYFDMRENDLLEIIGKYGVKKGGLLVGNYKLAKESSQVRILNVESDIYKSFKKADEVKAKIKTISYKELEKGYLYKTLTGDYALYLGKCNAINTKFEKEIKEETYYWNKKVKNVHIESTKIVKNKHLWFKFYSFDVEKKGKISKKTFEKRFSELSLTVSSSVKPINKIYKFDFKFDLKKHRENLFLDPKSYYYSPDIKCFKYIVFGINEKIELTNENINLIEKWFYKIEEQIPANTFKVDIELLRTYIKKPSEIRKVKFL